MEKFDLSLNALSEIAFDFKRKIGEGLEYNGKEIAGLPTYLQLKEPKEGEKVLVIDWGGTNLRIAIVSFSAGVPKVEEVIKSPLSAKETKGFEAENLFEVISGQIERLETLNDSVKNICYCFSYPSDSTLDEDAILLKWTKGIDIPDMLNSIVGKPLLDFLNKKEHIKTTFSHIKVINDTIACLLGGMIGEKYDANIGLIVGTGTNVAAMVPKMLVKKLDAANIVSESVPVNFESGNLVPFTSSLHNGYLTTEDELVDENSDNPHAQIFEKAISGKYIGEIFKYANNTEVEPIDGEKLNNMLNYPDIYKREAIDLARSIYVRSGKLVAASLFGLILSLIEYDEETKKYHTEIKTVCIAADGSLFWSEDKNGKDYVTIVKNTLDDLNTEYGIKIYVEIKKLDDPNLKGSAVAAIS